MENVPKKDVDDSLSLIPPIQFTRNLNPEAQGVLRASSPITGSEPPYLAYIITAAYIITGLADSPQSVENTAAKVIRSYHSRALKPAMTVDFIRREKKSQAHTMVWEAPLNLQLSPSPLPLPPLYWAHWSSRLLLQASALAVLSAGNALPTDTAMAKSCISFKSAPVSLFSEASRP